MKWNITKKSGRPLHKDQMKWDKEKQESVLIDPQKNEVDCLVKTYGEHSRPTIMTYVLDRDCWVDHNSCRNIPYSEVEKWQYISHIDSMLEGNPEPAWCFEFGSTLAETAVPALDHWIENGVSYIYGMTSDEWADILKKIRNAFAEARDILDGCFDSLQYEEREKKLDEAESRRQEAFSLLAKYYLSMWD